MKQLLQRLDTGATTLADVPVVFNDDPRVRFRHVDQLFAISLEALGAAWTGGESDPTPAPDERP